MGIINQLKIIIFLVMFGLASYFFINHFHLHDELQVAGKYYPSGRKAGEYVGTKIREKLGIKKRGDDCMIYCPIGQYCKKMPDAFGRISEVCIP